MKKFYKVLLVLTLFLGFGAHVKVFAQYNDAILTTAVNAQTALQQENQATNWAQKIKEWIETHAFQGQSIEAFANQLMTQELSLQTLRDGFKLASGFWSQASIVLDLYDAVQVIIEDVDRVQRQVDYFKTYKVYREGSGVNIMSPLMSTMNTARTVGGDAYEVFKFCKDQVFNQENSLTWGERMEMAQKSLQRLKTHHDLLSSLSADLDARQAMLTAKKSESQDYKDAATTGLNSLTRAAAANALLGNGLNKDQTRLMAEWIIGDSKLKPSAINSPSRFLNKSKGSEEKKTMDEQMGIDSEDKIKETGNSIVNAVFLAISLLAALFLGWNFWQIAHGDKQHMDALWKVGAGYIIMMLFLQVFKVVFF